MKEISKAAKSIFVLYIVLIPMISNAQLIDIKLDNTIAFDKKSSFSNTGKGLSSDEYKWAVETKKPDGNLKRLRMENFLWDRDISHNYLPLLYTTTKGSQDSLIIYADTGVGYSKVNTYSILNKDSFNLVFYSPKGLDDIVIPVYVSGRAGNEEFNVYDLHCGTYTDINSVNFKATVWPYQGGPLLNINQDSFSFIRKNSIKYLREGEIFSLGSDYFQFKHYDYINRLIQIEKKKLNESSKIQGYKEGDYISIDSMLALRQIKLDSKKMVLIYFGAKWCTWCKPENKRIKAMNNFLEKNDIELVSIIVRNKESDSELKDYIRDLNLPGEVIIEELRGSQNQILKRLKVSTFPSYIAIDKSNKIVFRSDYKDLDIDDFLLNILKAK